MKKRNITLFIAFAAAAAFASATQAATIYSDDFSGSAGNLNGTAPDTRPGSETWTAATGTGTWQLDGSGKATDVGGNRKFAFLPFTPAAGNEYTLSADVDVASGGWISLDFAKDSSTPGVAPDGEVWGSYTYAWMLRKLDGTIQTFTGLGTTGGATAPTKYTTGTLKIVLDTQPDDWTVEWFIGGSSIRSTTFGTNPTDIRWVGFGTESGDGTVDNFLLTDLAGPAATPGTLFYVK